LKLEVVRCATRWRADRIVFEESDDDPFRIVDRTFEIAQAIAHGRGRLHGTVALSDSAILLPEIVRLPSFGRTAGRRTRVVRIPASPSMGSVVTRGRNISWTLINPSLNATVPP
jgi:hypothetical protein